MEASSDDAESKSAVSEIEVKPEQIEVVHQEGPVFTCDLCDKELAYKIAQDLLSGLATACVDSTTGIMFKTPASVAADVRKEMVDYLSVRSESFVAESVVLDTDPGAEVSDHPLDILSNMIDDFAVSKKSLFSRVSGLMLSEMREDRIDEFTQGMERDSFWLLDKRESVAQTLIKNVDFKSLHHCNMKFASENEVIEHQETCGYRPMMCENEGCNDTFSVDSLEHHDSICPFKILPCEQHCSELLMRRDMDKHCITDCSMKLANCPFYTVGCQSPVPQCLIKKHSSENTHGHLLNVLQYIHKEASTEDVERWADQIEKSQFSDQLEVRDVRTFTMAVKDIEKRIGPFVASPKKPETVEDTPAPPSEQATVAPAEEAPTAPPTDQAAATPSKEQNLAPPSKERDLPSLSPQQDIASPPKEQDLPSLSPKKDTAPPLKEQDLPSLSPKKDTTPLSMERDLPSLSPQQDMAPPLTTNLPEQAVQKNTAQTDTETTPPPHKDATASPATTKPEHAVAATREETETTPPQQGTTSQTSIQPEQDSSVTVQKDSDTTSSAQGPTSPPTTTTAPPSVEEVPTAPPPEQPAANPSPQDSATADVQERATTSPSTDKAEPTPSPKQTPTSPPEQPES